MPYQSKVGGYNWHQHAVEVKRAINHVLNYLVQLEADAESTRDVADNRAMQIDLYRTLQRVEEMIDMRGDK